MNNPSQISHLLQCWSEGDHEALNELMPLLYDRMRQLAHQRLRSEVDGSLNTTALVHEAYLKLVDAPHGNVRERGHFLALASRVMRHLIVDHARARRALKRGGGAPLEMPAEIDWLNDDTADLIEGLDDALNRLKLLDTRQSDLLEQRYFGGLTLEETAEASGVSLATVKRELRSARAWLANQLRGEIA